jgi:hypothetical protein
MAAVNTKSLKATIDGVERDIELTKCVIARVEPDQGTVTFFEARQGGGDVWELRGTALQDPAESESLLNLLWDAAGTEVDVEVDLYGGGTASPTNPIYSGTVVVSMEGTEELLGGEASSGSGRFTFDFVWQFLEKPEKQVA